MEVLDTIDVKLSIQMGVGQGTGNFCHELNSFHQFNLFPWVWWPPWNLQILQNLRNPRVAQSLLRDRLHNWLLDGEKNCIVYHLFCMFTTTIIINYYYYSFLCCLIKLSVSQPGSFTFCPFSFPSHCRGREEVVSEQLSGAQLPAARLSHNTGLGGSLRRRGLRFSWHSLLPRVTHSKIRKLVLGIRENQV